MSQKRITLAAVLVPLALFGTLVGSGIRLGLMIHLDQSRDEKIRDDVGSPQQAALKPVAPATRERPDMTLLSLFHAVFQHIRNDYVERPKDEGELARGALRSMLASLNDPASMYLAPDAARREREAQAGRYHGIACTLSLYKTKHNDVPAQMIKVVSVIPGGGAAKAGLQPGDLIDEIDSAWIISHDPFAELQQEETQAARTKAFERARKRMLDGVTLTRAMERLLGNGEPFQSVTLVRGSQRKLVQIRPSDTSITPVEILGTEGGVRRIAIRQFTNDAPLELRKALKGAKRVVIDLRNNPGGSTAAAARCAGEIANVARLGYTVTGRPDQQVTTPITVPNPSKTPIRCSVVVNKGTAAAAEVFASALARTGAPVIGPGTAGDAGVSTLSPFADGSAMKLRTATLLTASRQAFHSVGIKPTRMASDVDAMSIATRLMEADLQTAHSSVQNSEVTE